MSAGMGKKIAIILSIFLLIIVLSIGCTLLTRPEQGSTVSDPDGIFLQIGDITITNQDMFERMKNQEGINHLLNYVDQRILSDFMSAIEIEDVQETILIMRYGTADQDEIDALTEEQKAQRLREYRFSLVLEGFNPDNDEEVETYARLSLARRHALRESYIEGLEADEETSLLEKVTEWYENNYRGDGVGILLVFQSQAEFENVMMHFNLVPDYGQAGIAKYIGERPIEEIYEDNDLEFIPDVNVVLLDADEVLEYYIKIYNYLYQHRTAMDESVTRDNWELLTEDFFLFDYREMNLVPRLGNIARYFFNTLVIGDEEDVLEIEHYSHTAQRLVTAQQAQQNQSLQGLTHYRFMVYKLHEAELTPYDELASDLQEEIEDLFVETQLTSDSVRRHMTDRRYAAGFMLHDEYLRLAYRETASPSSGITYFEETDDRSIIATLGDTVITTDDLFEQLLYHVGAFHVAELFQQHYLVASGHFEEVFGRNRNFDRNRSEMMTNLKNVIRNAEMQFAASQESWFYTWDEFLYIASQFTYTTNQDFLMALVTNELKPYFILDNIDFDHGLEFVEFIYDNYFKLRADHILVTLDLDENFDQDDLLEYLEGLSEQELAEYEALRDALYDELMAVLNDEEGPSMSELVIEYRDALRGEDPDDEDYSRWAVYKNYGFKLLYQDLGLRTNANSFNYVDEFVAALKVLYDRYLEEENNTRDFLFAESMVETMFGLHLIRGRMETGVEKLVMPSARFAGAEGVDEGWNNANDLPTRRQLELYAQAFFNREILGEDLDVPEELVSVMRELFLPYQNRLYQNQQGINLYADILFIQMIQAENPTFPIASPRIHTLFTQIVEVYEALLWPDFD